MHDVMFMIIPFFLGCLRKFGECKVVSALRKVVSTSFSLVFCRRCHRRISGALLEIACFAVYVEAKFTVILCEIHVSTCPYLQIRRGMASTVCQHVIKGLATIFKDCRMSPITCTNITRKPMKLLAQHPDRTWGGLWGGFWCGF